MCGIVAVVRRPTAGVPPELAPLLFDLDAVGARLAKPGGDDAESLREVATVIGAAARRLRGPLGAGALIADPVASAAFEHRLIELGERFAGIETALDQAADAGIDVDDIEGRNAALIECKDAVWALRCDRLATARAVVRPSPVAITTRTPARRRRSIASGVLALIGSATASSPSTRLSADRYMTLAPCARNSPRAPKRPADPRGEASCGNKRFNSTLRTSIFA